MDDKDSVVISSYHPFVFETHLALALFCFAPSPLGRFAESNWMDR